MPLNYKKLYALKNIAEKMIKDRVPNITNNSGIYIFYRGDESGLKFAYIGQAKHLIDRLVSHINGYSQRIDISIKKRGWYDKEKNPYGWQLIVLDCPLENLDKKEKFHILACANHGYQLYNNTSGGQGTGKSGINDGQSTKGYRQGVAYGREQMLKEVREFFTKYLTYDIKSPKTNKDGSPVAIKVKKLSEWEDLLNGE